MHIVCRMAIDAIRYVLCSGRGTAFLSAALQHLMQKQVSYRPEETHKASLVGFDINCLHPNTRILDEHGSWSSIKELENSWKKRNISLVELNKKELTTSNINRFMKKKEKAIFTITTQAGLEIKASGDHPILTTQGMKLACDVTSKDTVITYPFQGIRYEEPAEKTLVTLEDISRYLDKIGITNKGNAKTQIINRLKETNLLPLKQNSPQLPTIIRIMGFIYGDGVLTLVKGKKGFIHFYAEEEDLNQIKQDLKKIGITTQKIFKRNREHKIKTNYGVVEFEHEEKNIIKKSTGLAALLAVLGTPTGKKPHTEYRIPMWIKEAPLWQKRLFLSAFFGAELAKPDTSSRTNFYCPQLNMNKSEKIVNNGIEFLKDIKDLLAEFDIKANEPVFVEGNDYQGKYGKTKGLRLLINGKPENLLKLYGQIGYTYNKKKQALGCYAISYLKEKVTTIEVQSKVNVTKSGVLLERTINKQLQSFEEFKEQRAYGTDGLVRDPIKSIEISEYNDYVYDFTVNHKDHNFIANSIVTHNCGMRLVTTKLTWEQVKPKIKQLTDKFFETVPAGVGCKGFVKVTNDQFRDVMTDGVKWCVDNGYGRDADITHCEGHGKIDWADPSKISEKAQKRGINQIGTLGSGNHYLEVQVVKKENIHDEKIAKAYGLFENQVVVMVHCGSRGFGHQVATDHLKVFKNAMQKYKLSVPDKELSCAPFASDEGQDYYKAMACAANMAFANRQVILHRIREGFLDTFKQPEDDLGLDLVYDVAHNIAKREHHVIDNKRKEVVVHRKGSTRAFGPGHEELIPKFQKYGQPVILGGSMQTGSYLLVGTQQAMDTTFGSTAHGSGRTMSRTKAKKMVRGEQLQKEMLKEGIYVRSKSMSGLAEEAGCAYKDVNAVVDTLEGAGISKSVVRLIPKSNVKGHGNILFTVVVGMVILIFAILSSML